MIYIEYSFEPGGFTVAYVAKQWVVAPLALAGVFAILGLPRTTRTFQISQSVPTSLAPNVSEGAAIFELIREENRVSSFLGRPALRVETIVC